ncbi:protein rolling stone-like isoform X1 [Leptopilina boulardi]|uniref:protein rolling stone-like isoform X1 n=2 Tax=Leptopilina boulardi TaxID=63433 RepID=UPI0021F51D70|nr:protein rolling stone-like isoform X1 [Leptopilina boulardi]
MVLFTFRGFPTINRLLFFFGQCFTCRRAMVNKLWHRVSRKWSRLKPEPPHARLFSECRYQEEVRPWYLFYRWMMFLAWASIIICSIFEFGSYQPHGNNHLWGIYLTNWDLVLGLMQSFFGALIVTRRWKLQKCCDFNAINLELSPLLKSYWFLYVVTCTLALSVTIIYWSVIYNPQIHSVDILNILLHVFNSILMIVDMCMVKIPIFLFSAWWCLIVALLYVLFSIIYYAAGGVDKLGNHFIYAILDWKKPMRTVIVCLVVTIFLLIVHGVFCLLAKLADRTCSRRKTIDITEVVSTKNVEVIV